MSTNTSIFPIAATGLTATALVLAIFFSADFAAADASRKPSGCVCAEHADRAADPNFADLRTGLDVSDEVAALESLRYALTEIADGSTYVWHRTNGRLSGMIQPTKSFKDSDGAVCRHVVVVMNRAEKTNKTEAVACRGAKGVWKLDG